MIEFPLQLYVIVTGVGQCAVDQLALTPAGEPDRICLSVPGEIAWDNCECGSFTQTVSGILVSQNARNPTTVIGDTNFCGPGYLGLDVSAVILRCAPQPVEDELAPTCEALDTASRQWHYDWVAMRAGIICCLQAMRADFEHALEAFEIVSHTSVGPQGMCVGSQLNYRIWVPWCECPQ